MSSPERQRKFARLPTIYCAVCRVPVKQAIYEHSDDAQGFHITARCHGAEDRMFLSECFVKQLDSHELDELIEKGGLAFQCKEITNA